MCVVVNLKKKVGGFDWYSENQDTTFLLYCFNLKVLYSESITFRR